MGRTPLRIYYGPQEDSQNVQVSQTKQARQRHRPLERGITLAGRRRSVRSHLAAGLPPHDEVTISMDLYEVILAYQHYRRPSA